MFDQRTPESRSTWTAAHKSCFFFDEEIVCLGSAITSNDGRTVRTYLRAYPQATHVLSEGVGWLHDGAIGVVLPDRPTVHRETLTFVKDPAWDRLYIEHGVQPASAAYTAIYLPEVSAEETRDYAASPDVTVLARTAALHLVRDGSTGTTGGAFFDAASTWGYASDAPLLFVERCFAAEADSLAVANPTNAALDAVLTLPHPPTSWLREALDGAAEVTGWRESGNSTVITLTLPALGSLVLDHAQPTFDGSRIIPSPAAAWAGDTVTWTVSLHNAGGALVTPITVSLTLPAGVEQTDLCSSTLDPLPSCGGGTLTWSGVLSGVQDVQLVTAARLTQTDRVPLAAEGTIDVGIYGRTTLVGTLIANPFQINLPLVLKGGMP